MYLLKKRGGVSLRDPSSFEFMACILINTFLSSPGDLPQMVVTCRRPVGFAVSFWQEHFVGDFVLPSDGAYCPGPLFWAPPARGEGSAPQLWGRITKGSAGRLRRGSCEPEAPMDRNPGH